MIYIQHATHIVNVCAYLQMLNVNVYHSYIHIMSFLPVKKNKK